MRGAPGCPVWGVVLMYVTVGAKWDSAKVQFHGYSVIRLAAVLLLQLDRYVVMTDPEGNEFCVCAVADLPGTP